LNHLCDFGSEITTIIEECDCENEQARGGEKQANPRLPGPIADSEENESDNDSCAEQDETDHGKDHGRVKILRRKTLSQE
jgi:hypothetical protein